MKQMSVSLFSAVLLSGMACAQTPAVPAPAPASKTWSDYVTFKGDVRLRYETINDDSKSNSSGDNYTRDRARIRARLSAEGKYGDLKIGLGLSTGGADPLSGNQTLGDGFSKKEIRLDLAYIDYSVLNDERYELSAAGGKMKNPLITMPDDLIWDGDLRPEGLAVKGRWGNDVATLLLNGEGMWIDEGNTEKNVTGLAGQAVAELKFMPEIELALGVTCYAFQNIRGADVMDWENKNNAYGNSTIAGSVSGSTTNKAWAEDFAPVIGIAQLNVWLGIPLSLYGQYLANPKADDNKEGYMLGMSLGRAKNPGTFEIGYSYAELQKDSTLGMFTDSDRWGGGTDGRGHKFYAKYQLVKNLQAGTTFYLDEKNISDSAKTKNYSRFQIDLAASF